MKPTKVLIYAEPHPIRNSFVEFLHPAQFLAHAFDLIENERIEWRIFSNQFVLDAVGAGGISENSLIYPNDDEALDLVSYLHEWGDQQISLRNDLVHGKGDVSTFYAQVLRRIKDIFDYDMIFLWSENGAVKAVADKLGVKVFHCELGPTRKPFPETFYIDPSGTNGSACITQFKLDSFPNASVVPAETWLALDSGKHEKGGSVFEMRFDALSVAKQQTSGKYAVVALQLTDDLNMIDHSDFDTPKEFLAYILPPLLEQGFKVFIKGHPAARLRPSNLIHELNALEFAKSFGHQIVLLDRRMPAPEYLALISRAAVVCSVNSSVSLEALVLGVNGVVFGKAAFDIEGKLFRAGQNLLKGGRSDIEGSEKDKLLTILFRHYLHPFSPESAAKILQDICLADKNYLSDREFVPWLIRNTNYGLDALEDELSRTEWITKSQFRAGNASGIDSTIFGTVDELDIQRNGSSISCEARGWVARFGDSAYPITHAAISGGKDDYIQLFELHDRLDVRAAHPEITGYCGFRVKVKFAPGIRDEDLRLIFLADDCAYQTAVRLDGFGTNPFAEPFQPKQSVRDILKNVLIPRRQSR